ncbi:MAG: glycosyltransferase family 4 protein, partial [bacterium]|nr:glycosyltransferase family 4 protein [bacterium]
ARYLSRKGHKVTIIACMFHHLERAIPSRFRGKKLFEEEIDKVKILWVYSHPYSKNDIWRVINFVDFGIRSFLVGLRLPHQDIVLASSPHLITGISGYLLSTIKRSHFVFEVRDLWPETLIVLGGLKNKPLIWLLEKVERFLYDKARRIIVLTKGIEEKILQKKIPPEKISFIPNGIDLESFVEIEGREVTRERYNFTDKFICMYAGAHGQANALDVIIQTAKILRNYPEIFLVLLGDGPEKDRLMDLARKANLTNVIFKNPVSKKKIPDLLASSDVTIATLAKVELFKGARPNKLFDYMASGRPLICAIWGEASRVVEEAEAGICVEPENPQAMAEAILRLYNNPELRKRLGQNGRRYIFSNCSREVLASQIENILKCLILQSKEKEGLNER